MAIMLEDHVHPYYKVLPYFVITHFNIIMPRKKILEILMVPAVEAVRFVIPASVILMVAIHV